MVAEVAPAPTSLKSSGLALANRASETRIPNYETISITNNATDLSNGDSSAISNIPTFSPITSNAIGPVRRARFDVLSAFIAAYNSLRKSLAVSAESLKFAALMHATVVGMASTYNPYLDDNGSDEKQTASGEPYDPAAWTAAIRIDLREQFGGVRYSNNYRPTFALVEGGEKCVIVKINDVGPLKRGRVIDLNERSMRFFDPTQQLGLISNVKVTLLPGEDWTPGPIGSEQQINLAIAQ
jgi:rare lipoprotein A